MSECTVLGSCEQLEIGELHLIAVREKTAVVGGRVAEAGSLIGKSRRNRRAI
jgi:hypothetical protein